MQPLSQVRKRSHHELSGQVLLNLVRCLRRKPSPPDTTVESEAVPHILEDTKASVEAIKGRLLDWTMSVRCSGLLRGDQKAADIILNPDHLRSNSNSLQTAEDAQRVLLSISRILDDGTTFNDSSLLSLAADLLTAICEHIKTYASPDDECFIAESELITKAAKPLLGSLLLHLDSCNKNMIAAATSVFCVVTTKLSRSTDLINLWHDAIFRKCDEQAGPRLIASLPFIGGKQLKPFELYCQILIEYHRAIRLWIESVASIHWEPRKTMAIFEPLSIPQAREELRLLAICKIVQNEWLSGIKALESEEEKIAYFKCRLQFLMLVIVSLLRRDGFGCGALAIRVIEQQLKTRVFLDLTLLEDLLINFRAAAQSLSSRTKKRLLCMTTPEGVISIASTVSLAETVQAAGHTLLDVYVSCIGASGLLPFSKRLQRLSSEAIWLSTSTVVQNALEPETPATTRRDVFVRLRISSIQSYCNLIRSFGYPPRNKRDRNAKADRAIAVVSSTVVELLTTRQPLFVEPSENVELLVAAMETLKNCLDCGGENLVDSVRNLVNSVGYTCFKALNGRTRHPLLCYGAVRLSVTRLAGSMLCVPHQDGSSSDSELVRSIHLVAEMLRYDQDSLVNAEAISLLQICKAISCPRRPTLHIAVHRNQKEAKQPNGQVVDLEEKIAVANLDLNSAEIESDRIRVERENTDEKVAPNDLEGEDPKHLPVLFPTTDDNSEPLFGTLPHQDTFLAKTDQIVDSCAQVPRHNPKESFGNSSVRAKEEDFDDEMPLIVDCGPDEDDKD